MSDDTPISLGESTGPPSATIKTEYDWASTTPSSAVVETFAIVSNERPTALPPLYPNADLDALDALLEPRLDSPTASDVRVSFSYESFDVTVASGGTVTVTPQREVDT